jgi:TolB-like protein/DNA-binding winged helix-turn-helix (wHTH) protein/Flp pilus assembly protein TadD
MEARPSQIYRFDEFRVDALKRRVWRRNGEPVPLTPRVFDTLLYLVQHSGAVLEKERLMEAVWPDAVVEENNLSKNISTLRRIFGEGPGSQGFILTVPGYGYRFVAAVTTTENTEPVNGAGPASERMIAQTNGESVAAVSQASPASSKGKRYGVVLTISALLLLGFAALLFFRSRGRIPAANTSPAITVSGKSIAVLPFANLSADEENAFFTQGMQDDILTALAKIADLKVISRTSVASYIAGSHRNFRDIGQELGVSRVLEGSVRRGNDRVRVTVQLIDTRTNTHVWAETYDRSLADVFAIQTEIAQQIAAALKARLAPEEEARLGIESTSNSEAYVLYLTALGKEGTDEIAAEQLYVEAAALDPKFALAYARASLLNSQIASYNQHREQKAKARAQAEEALRLSPTLGEGHMALGLCLYWGEKNYDAALKEFELAAQISPSNAKIYDYVGGIYRRQGRWREAVASYERALSLDPRNASIANFAGNNYLFVRDWPAAAACYNHALEIKPDYVTARIRLACLEVFRNANPAAGRRILENIPASLDSDGEVALTRWDMAMLERDYAAAEKILSDLPVEKFQARDAPKTYYQGRTALARGDKESAQRYFTATIPALEKWVRDAPNDPQRHGLIGLLYAYLHRNEDAIREVRRNIELEPESQDAFHGAMAAADLAMVYALIGEQDPAITLIERLLSTPGPFPGSGADSPSEITLADLRLRWEWDSLRSNPRFQKILASPEPKTILTATR